MNTLALLTLMLISLETMFVMLDHHHFAQLTVQLLEKRKADDYLIAGLLAYGRAYYGAKSGKAPRELEIKHEPAGKHARSCIVFSSAGDRMNIGCTIQQANSVRKLEGGCSVRAIGLQPMVHRHGL